MNANGMGSLEGVTKNLLKLTVAVVTTRYRH